MSDVPIRIAFSLHEVARADDEEAYFVRQITRFAAASDTPSRPIVAVVFGQGHMIPLVGEELTPDIIAEVCWFLCNPCSCRIKALNPGVDLLMGVSWDDALEAYPEPAITVLPDGTEFALGGTATVVSAVATPDAAPPPVPRSRVRRGPVFLLTALAVGVVVLLGCLLSKSGRSFLLGLLTTRSGVRRD